MNFLRRSPVEGNTSRRSVEPNIYSSQESLNSNGFSIGEKRDSQSTDSANEIDSERFLNGKMIHVPIIHEMDESVNLSNASLNRENSPEHSMIQSTTRLLSGPAVTPNSCDDKEEWQTTKNRHSVERKHSDRSSSDYHETSPDKLEAGGDNSTSMNGPPCDRSVDSRGSIDGSFDRSLDYLVVKLGEKPGEQGGENGAYLEVSGKSSIADSGSKSGNEVDAKKKKKSWYTVLNPTYKSRTQEFRKFFKDIPKEERLIVDYSCAYQKDILIQGRMYLTQNWICFYANIFTWETVLMVPCKEIVAVTKEKTARVIPNALQISTQKDKMFFTSFTSRDKAFLMVFRIWQNSLLDKQMPPKEIWHWVHYSYGDQLGLTGSDDECVSPSGLEESVTKVHARSRSRPRRGLKTRDIEREDEIIPPNSHTLTHNATLHDIHSSNVSLDTSITSGVVDAPIDGDSSGADSPGEVVCSDHNHLDKVYLNEAFDLPVDKVFEFLFSDSKFFRDFCTSRKTFNLSLPDWQPEPNADGDREREIRYTLTLSASIGPKYSPSSERQIYHAECQPGFIYVVDAHCYNGGIPYADTFYVTNRYCITRVTQATCRLRVSSELRYIKSIWGLVKNMIDKNARHGLTAYFQQLESHLRRESKKYEQMSPCRVTQKKQRRRRKNTEPSSGETDRLTSEPSTPVRRVATDGAFGLSGENLVRLLCFVLVLLFVFNAVLFYKLFYLEGVTQSLTYTPLSESIEHFVKSSQTPDDWLTLLQRQQRLHQMEVDKWRDVLGGVVLVLDQIRDTLSGLQEMLNQRKTTGPSSSPPKSPHKHVET